ncbi:methionine adenosyltransferase [uncultured Duncaniella sp.]|uniref:methionine adenosyltransferase n=1 Tax=uncultured Duncaniella sp. TaxID=2768039 RepID=UPI00272C70B2|nr:methionine adenosyltransferase [uncultured Duncaniella sp.]
MNTYLFTSESVSEGHPDKVADQISDAVLDEFLARDPSSKVACETLVTTGQVIIAGEVKSNAYIDLMDVTREVIKNIGYDRSELKFDGEACGVFSALHEQSADINRGVEREQLEGQGAGDQGMMFGYACAETPDYMPLTLDLSHRLLRELAHIRREGAVMTYEVDGRPRTYLRPDSKSQVTVEYDSDNRPLRVDTIVISTQHDEFITPAEGQTQAEADEQMRLRIEQDVRDILVPRVKAQLPAEVAALIGDDYRLLVNPTGKFVIGGPHGDTGLTGRKIIVDTYGGRGAHGGGAFSGKDPSKVDRSAAYAARHIAKNLVAAGVAREVLVQVAYAIGKAEPVSLCINTYGTSRVSLTDREIADKVLSMPCFDMTPYAIEKRFNLRQPIYRETASYGHMGRQPRVVTKRFHSKYEPEVVKEVELFTWEKLDAVDEVKKAFGIA